MNPPLHPEEVKAQLRMRHGTISAFEKSRGLPPRTVSQILFGKAIRKTAEAIADELDIPLHRVSQHYHDLYYNLSTSPRYRRDGAEAQRLSGRAS